MRFRLTITTRPDGLSVDERARLQADGFHLMTSFPHYERATWPGDDAPVPGQQFVYVTDAEREADAEQRARAVVGPDLMIRVTRHYGDG